MYVNPRVWRTTLAVCLAVGTFAGLASARSAGGHIGRAAQPSQASCLSPWYGTLGNSCSSPSQIEIDLPLPVDSAGNKNVTVSLTTGPGNGTYCQAFGLDKDTTTVWSSINVVAGYPPGSTTTGTNRYDLALTGAYVPSNGYLYTACQVWYQARISGVTWTS